MMKKVLYGVALALFASVSVGSLQSCKDDVNDLKTQTSYDLSKVRYDLSQLDLRVTQNAQDIAKKADKDYVDGLIGDLQEADRKLGEKIQGALDRLDKIEPLLETFATKEYVDGEIGAVRAEITALDSVYGEKFTTIGEKLDSICDELDGIKDRLDAAEDEIDAIEDALAELQKQLDSVIERLDKQVTGLLIQGVYSPVFGDFRLPIGIKSNMLFNWYGENTIGRELSFPSEVTDLDATGFAGKVLTPSNDAFKVPEGEFGDAEDGAKVTLGKVYVTVNPVGAQFDDLVLKIENSKGDRLPMTVALSKSEEILYHGYTRAEADGNGFYEGEVLVDINDIVDDGPASTIRYEISEDLKASIKDAVKDPSKMTAKELVKAVYDQLTAKGVPAYGLRYDWSAALEDVAVPEGDEDDEALVDPDPTFSNPYSNWAYAVLSQYDLAVVTAKPLSYNFLKGAGANVQLPTVGNIQNLIEKIKELGSITLNFGEFSVEGFDVDLGNITVAVKDAKIIVTIPEINVTGETGTIGVTAETTLDEKDINTEQFTGAIESAIQDALSQASTEINGKVATMVASINKQVNDLMDNINTQIGNVISNKINDVTNKLEPYFGKINKAFDLYNKVANKVNNFIKNPNNYLQVCAFYDMGGAQYGIASGVASDPTIAEAGNFKLFLSSYTGELIVPACKKYVAITAIDGKAATAADNSGDLNKVLDGNQIEVVVEGLASGKTYEFTYQALDYHGYTSTKKFYIKVK